MSLTNTRRTDTYILVPGSRARLICVRIEDRTVKENCIQTARVRDKYIVDTNSEDIGGWLT